MTEDYYFASPKEEKSVKETKLRNLDSAIQGKLKAKYSSISNTILFNHVWREKPKYKFDLFRFLRSKQPKTAVYNDNIVLNGVLIEFVYWFEHDEEFNLHSIYYHVNKVLY